MSVHAAPTETRPGGGFPFARPGTGAGGRARRLNLAAVSPNAWGTALVALGLCLITFVASGGLSLDSTTEVEMGLTLLGGIVVAATVVAYRAQAIYRPFGLVPMLAMLALAALTALSVSWSVQPDASWQEASRTLAYAATFCGAVTVARVARARWPAVLGGIVVAGAIVCGWALLTKVFPAQLNANEIYARLRAPYDYWNAIGLTAAMVIPPCLWLGARRSGHAALNALAYPVVGLALVTLLLAYSRGALLALAIGLILWFTAVPLRLRGATVLLVSAAGAAVVVLWDFSQPALTQDHVPLSAQSSSGHQLGVLLVAMVLALTAAGLAIGFLGGRRAVSLLTRRRAGAVLLGAVALVPVVVVIGLAASHRGLTGSISHDFNSLTNVNAKVPPNSPGRLTAIGSVRARYWREALKSWEAHPVLGTGAGGYATARLRYAQETLNVEHAHGYVVQTLADMGLVGLAVSLALLAAWLAAALRSTRPYGLRWQRRLAQDGRRLRGWRLASVGEAYTPERIGLLTMLSLVLVFGVHSLVDWTWFVPGDACVALLCAGWLAGRGPAGAPRQSRTLAWAGRPFARSLASLREVGSLRTLAAVAILAFAGVGAWAEFQPLHASNVDGAAGDAFDSGNTAGAIAQAQRAVRIDPLSVYALFQLAAFQQGANQLGAAQRTLVRAVQLQPANPDTWLELAGFYDSELDKPRQALAALRPAIYLDPQSVQAQDEFVSALRLLHPTAHIAGAVAPTPTSNPGPVGPTG